MKLELSKDTVYAEKNYVVLASSKSSPPYRLEWQKIRDFLSIQVKYPECVDDSCVACNTSIKIIRSWHKECLKSGKTSKLRAAQAEFLRTILLSKLFL
jgi:hypothetical protein